jgi:predicted permease
MRDWRAYVRERLPRLACSPAREGEIVDELAQQLQDIHESALRAGASPVEAEARLDAEIHDWAGLARDLMSAEQPMLAGPRRVAVHHVEPAVNRFQFGQRCLEAVRDTRYAVRSLAAQPLFTATTLLTLAIGIGAATVVFSLVHSVLLAPLPYREPDRLVVVQQVVPEIADRFPILGVNPRSFIAWEGSCTQACGRMAAIARATATLTGAGEPEGLVGHNVSPSFFDVLGFGLQLGRPFLNTENVPGNDRVVIITYGFWQRRFGGDPSIVGRAITLDGIPVEVVGVLPAGFRVPQLPHVSPPNDAGSRVEFFRPLAWREGIRRSWGSYDNLVVLRLADGASLAMARDELTSITTAEFAPAPIHPYPVLRSLADGVTADARRPLWLLLGSVGAALLIACVNVASLIGGRWIGRQRELAIRTAMGAGRGRLAMLVAIETTVLAGGGGLLGFALAALSLQGIVARAPAAVPRLDEVRLDVVSLLFAAAVTVACALICAILPAWRGARIDPGDTLKGASHTTTGAGRWTAIRGWLVGGEVALTTMLLLVGGLLVASFVNVLAVDRGFATASIVAADVEVPAARYKTEVERAQFFAALLDGLDRAPGIDGAGVARALPLEGEGAIDAMIPVGNVRPVAEQPVGNHVPVSAGYFEVFGIPLLRGRALSRDDDMRRVAVINDRAARTLWPGEDAIGKSFTRGDRNVSWEVVGIVADSRVRGLERDPGLVAYMPYGLGTPNRMSIVVRAPRGEAGAVAGLRRAVAALDSQLPLQRVRAMDTVLDDALAMRRFQIALMMAFAAAGLLLAALGVYGVLSAAVEGRRGELAIRLALGASPARVQRLIVRQGLVPIALGLLIGLGGGIAVARILGSLLFGVTPTQPIVLVLVAAVVTIVGAAACATPALRASRTSVVSMLRR